jgi:hypothetical protein
MDCSLAVPGSRVVDEVRGKTQVFETHTATVRGPETCLSKR